MRELRELLSVSVASKHLKETFIEVPIVGSLVKMSAQEVWHPQSNLRILRHFLSRVIRSGNYSADEGAIIIDTSVPQVRSNSKDGGEEQGMHTKCDQQNISPPTTTTNCLCTSTANTFSAFSFFFCSHSLSFSIHEVMVCRLELNSYQNSSADKAKLDFLCGFSIEWVKYLLSWHQISPVFPQRPPYACVHIKQGTQLKDDVRAHGYEFQFRYFF